MQSLFQVLLNPKSATSNLIHNFQQTFLIQSHFLCWKIMKIVLKCNLSTLLNWNYYAKWLFITYLYFACIYLLLINYLHKTNKNTVHFKDTYLSNLNHQFSFIIITSSKFLEQNTNIQKINKTRPCPRAIIDGKRLFLSIRTSFADSGNTNTMAITYTA